MRRLSTSQFLKDNRAKNICLQLEIEELIEMELEEIEIVLG
jgi:hypothetical protein